jgi:alpha-L-arabinofuranosidase
MIFSFEYGGTYSQYIRFPHKKRGTMWAVEQYNNFDDNDSYWLLTRAIKGSEKPYPFTYEGYGHQYYPLNSDRVFGHNGGPVFTDKNSGKMNFHDYGITLVPKGKYWLVKQDEYWAIVMKSANSDFPYDPEKFKNQRLSSYDFMTSIERESTFFDPKKPHKPITDSDNPGYRRIDA